LISVAIPVIFPAPSLLVPCYEFAPPGGKAYGINGLNVFADQKREIFPAFFPDHGNLANRGMERGQEIAVIG
jgi:hypothetical protein